MTILWVRIRSWHALRDDNGHTLCGRQPPIAPEWSEMLPAGKSCETCLRIVARRADA